MITFENCKLLYKLNFNYTSSIKTVNKFENLIFIFETRSMKII